MPLLPRIVRAWRLLLLVPLPALARAAATTPTALTVSDFFRPPAVIDARLNPAGSHLAMTVYEEKSDSIGLRIYDFATERTEGLRGTKLLDIFDFNWVGDETIIYSVSRDNLYSLGLFAIHRDRPNAPITLNYGDVLQVLASPQARPGHLLVWIKRSADDEGRPGPLLEINLRDTRRAHSTGEWNVVTRIPTPPGDVVRDWMCDRNGEVRYAVTQTRGEPKLYLRDPDQKWQPLATDLAKFQPLAVDLDPRVLLGAWLKAGASSELVRLNTTDGTMGPPLHSDKKYDLSHAAIHFSRDERTLLGLSYSRQAPTQIWLDPQAATLQRNVDRAMPRNRINRILSRNNDDSRLIVLSASDRHPGTVFLYEPGTNLTAPIADLAPWLPENLLGEVKLLSFKARDGLQLDGYVTLPVGYRPGQPGPMIVLPHGGPSARDEWGYNAEAQFFASRGYVVFQPNYRGSTGYHAPANRVSPAEFRRMHDDVTDGTRALINAGIANPAHIAIVGSSFGGYLAVCGAAFEPGLYRCAVTVAGVFDWAQLTRDMLRNDADRGRYDRFVRDLGDPKAEWRKLAELSPIEAVEQIRAPVFVAHGEEDTIADAGQSRRLVKALRQNKVPCEAMFQRNEGHGFAALRSRVELYTRIESFLKKNL